eukprot:c9360_g1_i1.p1 GENE.c9360_g1_i1~~c9360_g1_i1.p1  ORF type:complete len:525 (+),score=139.82 c9360_g1_i1:39-1613(+)
MEQDEDDLTFLAGMDAPRAGSRIRRPSSTKDPNEHFSPAMCVLIVFGLLSIVFFTRHSPPEKMESHPNPYHPPSARSIREKAAKIAQAEAQSNEQLQIAATITSVADTAPSPPPSTSSIPSSAPTQPLADDSNNDSDDSRISEDAPRAVDDNRPSLEDSSRLVDDSHPQADDLHPTEDSRPIEDSRPTEDSSRPTEDSRPAPLDSHVSDDSHPPEDSHAPEDSHNAAESSSDNAPTAPPPVDSTESSNPSDSSVAPESPNPSESSDFPTVPTTNQPSTVTLSQLTSRSCEDVSRNFQSPADASSLLEQSLHQLVRAANGSPNQWDGEMANILQESDCWKQLGFDERHFLDVWSYLHIFQFYPNGGSVEIHLGSSGASTTSSLQPKPDSWDGSGLARVMEVHHRWSGVCVGDSDQAIGVIRNQRPSCIGVAANPVEWNKLVEEQELTEIALVVIDCDSCHVQMLSAVLDSPVSVGVISLRLPSGLTSVARAQALSLLGHHHFHRLHVTDTDVIAANGDLIKKRTR